MFKPRKESFQLSTSNFLVVIKNNEKRFLFYTNLYTRNSWSAYIAKGFGKLDLNGMKCRSTSSGAMSSWRSAAKSSARVGGFAIGPFHGLRLLGSVGYTKEAGDSDLFYCDGWFLDCNYVHALVI